MTLTHVPLGAAHPLILFGSVAVVGFLTVGVVGVNLWQFSRYLDARRHEGDSSGTAKAAWIVSLVAWWTGPLVLIGAPVAIIMAVVAMQRPPHQPTTIAARMAIGNSVWIFV